MRAFVNSLLLIFSLGLSNSLFAQTEEIESGVFRFLKDDGKEITSLAVNTRVKMDIAGLVARVRVEQTFRNDSADWVEGTYLFPLPEKSAVDTLKMKIGERIIVGEIKEKQQAKAIYGKAKREGRKASLVKQLRPNIFSNSVANIAPYEEVVVTIEYQQDLIFQKNGELSIRFPMTITERYTPLSKVVEEYQDLSKGFVTEPNVLEILDLSQTDQETPDNGVEIDINLESGLPVDYISSKSHRIVQSSNGESAYKIRLSNAGYKADRDFLLSWKLARATQPKAALFSEVIDGESYLSLMVMPPKTGAVDYRASREVIFVLDSSGSMGGESIRQAKAALLAGLDTLEAGDRFNIIEFDSSTQLLFDYAREFTDSTRLVAERFIANVSADGGTEMVAAMDAALDGKQDRSRIRQVIFLTDGAIGNEAELFKLIQMKLGDSRLFTVGIGSAPNEFFMKRAAQYGRGTFTFVSNQETAEQTMRELFVQISQPVLTHIDIQWPNSDTEMWPKRIPDLFAGEPLWVKAKVSNARGDITINGRLRDELWQGRLRLDPGKKQKGIAKLWAREKIASLMNRSSYGRVIDSDKALIIETALQHHLVSRYTSLVAVDKTPSRINAELKKQRIQSESPKGQANPSIQYPKTALNITITPMQSFALILLSLAGWLVLKKR